MAKITPKPPKAERLKTWRGGRHPKNEANLRAYYYGFRLDELQNIEFERLYELSGARTKSEFILSAIFDKPLKIVKIDKAAMDYYVKLTNLQSQYRAIGVNYNQAVKAINTELSEKKALSFLYKLEQHTLELVRTTKEIIRMTEEFEQKYLQVK